MTSVTPPPTRTPLDTMKNNDWDTLANMGDNVSMDLPTPKPHNIMLQ